MLPAVYGINHFPVPAPLPRYKFERCDADNVGDPFNPYGVAPLPTGEAVTFDQFSIGKRKYHVDQAQIHFYNARRVLFLKILLQHPEKI